MISEDWSTEFIGLLENIVYFVICISKKVLIFTEIVLKTINKGPAKSLKRALSRKLISAKSFVKLNSRELIHANSSVKPNSRKLIPTHEIAEKRFAKINSRENFYP